MSVRSGMADCAVALDALRLRIAPPESLDVTKLAHAFVTLARPRRRMPVTASMALRGPGATETACRPGPDTSPPTRQGGRWPPRACWPGLCQPIVNPCAAVPAPQLPGPPPETPPRQHPATRDRSPPPSACCQPDRSRRWRSRPAPPHAAGLAGRYGCDHPGIHRYGQTRASSSCAWDTKPEQRIRRTSPHPGPTRKTTYYAAARAAVSRQCLISGMGQRLLRRRRRPAGARPYAPGRWP